MLQHLSVFSGMSTAASRVRGYRTVEVVEEATWRLRLLPVGPRKEINNIQ